MDVTTTGSFFLFTHTTLTSSGDAVVGNATNVGDFNTRITYLSIGLLGMLGNFIVVSVMMRSPTLRRKSTNVLILNQSLIDFCAAFFVIAHAMVRDLPSSADRMIQDIFCRLWKSSLPMWGLFISSTYNLIAMTLDGYVALVHPIVHRKSCSRNIVYVIMAAVWIFGTGHEACYTIPTSGLSESGKCIIYEIYPSAQIQRLVGILLFTLQYFIPLFTIIFAYTRIALVLRRGFTITSENGVHRISGAREQRMLDASKKVFKTLLTVSVSFVVCWSPNQILYLMYNCGVPINLEGILFHFSVVLAFLNCCINPIIYCLKYEEFQRELVRQVRCWNSSSSEISSDCSTSRKPHRGEQPPEEERKRYTSSEPCSDNSPVVSAVETETQQVVCTIEIENPHAVGTVDTEKQVRIPDVY